MSAKSKKQFGVWMDTHHATVIGLGNECSGEFSVLGKVTNPGADGNSSGNAEQHQAQTLLHQYFKGVASFLTNADEVHVTGTGTAQEQFVHYLAETPQFKDVLTSQSTATSLSDDYLVKLIFERFN